MKGLDSSKFKLDSDGKAELVEKSALGHWGAKVAAGVAIGLGIVASLTGAGAGVGAFMIVAGLGLYGASQAVSAHEAAQTAEANNENPKEAVAWDIAKGFAQLAVSASFLGYLAVMYAVVSDAFDGGGSGSGGGYNAGDIAGAYVAGKAVEGSMEAALKGAKLADHISSSEGSDKGQEPKQEEGIDTETSYKAGLSMTNLPPETPIMPHNQHPFNPASGHVWG
ncbi:MAG: hypothetical protein AAGH74_11560 [Pseudomonadota bacterium]